MLFLDWNLQKYNFYFTLVVFVIGASTGIKSIDSKSGSFYWSEILAILFLVFLFLRILYLDRLSMKNDILVVFVSRLWKTIARQLVKTYLNLRWGRENYAMIYRELGTREQEIRLVTILPGEGDSTVQCLLHHTTLGPSLPAYDALSYTWGPCYSLCSIIVNGSPLHITRNLGAALRRLRLSDVTRHVWIDAICINQTDNDERSEQVQIMRKIYTHAKEVIVWLGDGSNKSDCAMAFLELANDKTSVKEWFKMSIKQTTNGSFRKEWKAVFKLLQNDYWKRVWIIQEIACATELRLHCGSRSVPWEILKISQLAWLEAAKDPATENLRDSMRSIQSVGGGDGHAGFLRLEADRIALQDPSQSQRLVNLMYNYWDSEATDDRDKIYALIGIAGDCKNPALPVDYSMPVWDTYIHTMEFLLKSTGRLDMISYSGMSNYIRGRPTWCPSFYSKDLAHASRSSRHLVGLDERHPFACCRDKLANARFVRNHQIFDKFFGIDSTILEVQCGCVDVISRCLLHRKRSSWKLGPGPKLLQKYGAGSSTWVKDKQTRHKIELIRILYYFLSDTDSASPGNQEDVLEEDKISEQLCQTLTYGQRPKGSKGPENWSAAFSILMDGPPSNSADSTPETSDYSDVEVALSLVTRFMATIDDVIMSGRWLFMTKNGRLGIASQEARIGDTICVIPGCDIPMVIRVQKRTRHNGFNPEATPASTHGSAYLHGYMYGKAMDDLNTWRLSLRDFALS